MLNIFKENKTNFGYVKSMDGTKKADIVISDKTALSTKDVLIGWGLPLIGLVLGYVYTVRAAHTNGAEQFMLKQDEALTKIGAIHGNDVKPTIHGH